MPNPPAAPNFQQAAQAQGAANLTAAQQQARLNNANFNGIGGSQTVTFNADGTPNVTQSLDPTQQGLYQNWTNNQAQAGQAASGLLGLGQFGGAFDLSGAPAMGSALDMSSLPSMPGNYDSTRQSVISAMMGRANEGFAQREDQTNSDLIARGLRPGTEAYAREMTRIDQARNDAYQQAEIAGGNAADQAMRADLARRAGATGEQAQQFQQQSALRGQGVNEYAMGREMPMSEYQTLLGASQFDMPNMPGYSQNNQVAPAPVYGATTAQSNYDVDVWNAEQQQRNSQMNGLFQLGGNFLNSGAGQSLVTSGLGWLADLFKGKNA